MRFECETTTLPNTISAPQRMANTLPMNTTTAQRNRDACGSSLVRPLFIAIAVASARMAPLQ